MTPRELGRALGRLAAGKPKRVTPAVIAKNRLAGKASALARRKRVEAASGGILQDTRDATKNA